MTRVVKLSPDLSIPLEVVTRKVAILGISGSGKTYCAGKLTEEMLDAGAQVVVIDTVGNWYGLRLSADGKHPGIAIPVFGGSHGDVPLEATAGEMVAELVAQRRISVVLDVSDFTEGEKRKFVTAFARRLLVEKKNAPGPMMVLWEECHECVPQRVDAADAQMVGAVERLIKKGRNYGVGTTLVSQQPQAVNKAVLNQAQLLIALQTSGKHERKAIEGWVDANMADAHALDELASLERGTAIVWSPAWLRILKTVKIGKKRTYDASATPDFGTDSFKPGALAKVDLDQIRVSMAETIERAQAEDPKALRKRIADLEKLLSAMPAPVVTEKRVEVQVIDKALVARLEVATGKFFAAVEKQLERRAEIAGSMDELLAKVRAHAPAPSAATFSLPKKAPPFATDAGVVDYGRDIKTNGNLGSGSMTMLRVLVQRNAVGTSRTQLATLSGYSQKSSTFGNYLSALNSGGYLHKENGLFFARRAGIDLVGDDVPPPPTGRELLSSWMQKLSGRAKNMLHSLTMFPDGLTRDALAEAVALSPTSSTYGNYLSALNSNGLIEKRDGRFFAKPEFLQ